MVEKRRLLGPPFFCSTGQDEASFPQYEAFIDQLKTLAVLKKVVNFVCERMTSCAA